MVKMLNMFFGREVISNSTWMSLIGHYNQLNSNQTFPDCYTLNDQIMGQPLVVTQWND
jgi:hypothetical protein